MTSFKTDNTNPCNFSCIFTIQFSRYLPGLFIAQAFLLTRFRLGISLQMSELDETQSIVTAQLAYHLPLDFVAHEVVSDQPSLAMDRPKRNKHTCRRCFECREGIRVVTGFLFLGLLPVLALIQNITSPHMCLLFPISKRHTDVFDREDYNSCTYLTDRKRLSI